MERSREEVEALKAAVGCAVVLEQACPPWRLDARQSTRSALKYRRGKGEIIIVNHDGRGWWDPGDPYAKGDVLGLLQHLQPGLGFSEACGRLGELVGLEPRYPAVIRPHTSKQAMKPVEERWATCPVLAPGSWAWRYLTHERALPEMVLRAAIQADALREGPRGSAWFAHRDAEDRLTGIDMRGPGYRGFSAGGDKALFQLAGGPAATRLALCEGSLDALSLAALEGLRGDTLYLASGGGMGPGTLGTLASLLQRLSGHPDALLLSATDADAAGDRYAEQLNLLAKAAGIRAARQRPGGGHKDWNEVLKAEGRLKQVMMGRAEGEG